MICPHCRAAVADDARFCGSCGSTLSGQQPPARVPTPVMATGAASAAALDGLIGRTVGGRYRVVNKLGQGGMGTVFRAEQLSVKRLIALKVLDPTLGTDPELIRRFNAEAEVAGRLSHPNTVTLFDFGQDETGLLFIAMELVKGTSVRDVLQAQGAIAPGRAVDISEQIASSLADAHAHGIVHRDLKPDNVILSERAGRQDFVRVLDFGIAKLRDDRGTLAGGGQAMTRAGQLLGTPAYMSPEQIEAKSIDGRTDVYALGVMLYEMLSGRLPFDATSLMALLAMHLHDAPVPIEHRRPDIILPLPLRNLVMRCLNKRPEDRPADMKAVLAELGELKAALGGRPSTGAMPAAPVYSPPPFAPPYTPPPASMPVQQHATPAPAWPPPQAATPPPQTPQPALAIASSPWVPPPATAPATQKKKSKAIWIVALVGTLAIAIAVPLALHGKGDKVAEDKPTPPSQPSDPPPGPSSPKLPPTTFTHSTLGYQVTIPGGMIGAEQQNGGYLAGGVVDGKQLGVAVAPVTGAGDLANYVSGVGGKIVEERTRLIDDEDHASYIFEQAEMRCEGVLYQGQTMYAVMFCVQPAASFVDTASERDDLFRRGFKPGSGGGGN